METTNSKNNEDLRVPTEDRRWYIDLKYEGRIYVNKKIYSNYKQDDWRDRKRNDRGSRCVILGKRGFLVRCMEDCSKCPHKRTGDAISLDYERDFEMKQIEIEDKSEDILAKVCEEERNKKLWEAVNELDDIDREIMILFANNVSERDIAKKVDLGKTAVNSRKQKCFKILNEKLKDFKIY